MFGQHWIVPNPATGPAVVSAYSLHFMNIDLPSSRMFWQRCVSHLNGAASFDCFIRILYRMHYLALLFTSCVVVAVFASFWRNCSHDSLLYFTPSLCSFSFVLPFFLSWAILAFLDAHDSPLFSWIQGACIKSESGLFLIYFRIPGLPLWVPNKLSAQLESDLMRDVTLEGIQMFRITLVFSFQIKG